MAERFLKTMLTPAVLAAQQHYYGRSAALHEAPQRDVLTEEESAFIESRDSFYMSTVSEEGWPYVQHRGGKPGFLKVIDPTHIAFADYKGNRQMLSTGNLAANDKVALFLMDYPRRERLKMLGHVTIRDARQSQDLVTQLASPEMRPLVERVFLIEVIGFDWNCPKYITPRFTSEEIEVAIQPLKQRITELEAQLSKSKPNTIELK